MQDRPQADATSDQRNARPRAPTERVELLSLALRVFNAGYFTRDLSTNLVHWAPETYRLWGLPEHPEGIDRALVVESVHPDDRAQFRARDVDQSWDESVLDFRIRRPDGEVRNMRSLSIRERDETGKPVRVYGAHMDVTDMRRTESALLESEARFRSLLETSGAGMCLTRLDGTIRYTNDAFARMLGYGADELEGRNVTTLSPPGETDPLVEMVPELVSGLRKSVTIEKRYARKNGDMVWAKLSVNMVTGGTTGPGADTTVLVGVTQDISERKRSEDVLRKAIVNAEGANRAKTKFLANMSHELRTPLNAILGFAQLLLLKTKGTLTPEQEAYAQSIVQGGEHLLKLINDVLDLARIDTGKLVLSIEPVSAAAVVRHVMQNLKQMAETRGVSFHAAADNDVTALAAADTVRLTQVLTNLTSNAVKYNLRGGRVSFAITRPLPQVVRMSVTDTGRGIPREKHPEVFESFNRLGAEIHGEEGTGIGLSLSKRLVEEMGGQIGFTSEPGAGSTFWIDLPAAEESAELFEPSVILPAIARQLTG